MQESKTVISVISVRQSCYDSEYFVKKSEDSNESKANKTNCNVCGVVTDNGRKFILAAFDRKVLEKMYGPFKGVITGECGEYRKLGN